jgi:protein-S-isoprenylcysteine O-methyltransferase Ste14
MGSLTPFLVAVAFGVSLEMVFVRAEESMLERRFAGARQEYKKRVRRWI